MTAQHAGIVGRELRAIHVDLTQAIARSAERVKALDRVAQTAAARRNQKQEPGHHA